MSHGTLIIEVVGDAWGGFKSASRQSRMLAEPLALHEAEALRAALLRRPQVHQMVYARPDAISFGDFQTLDDVRLILRTWNEESTTTDDGRPVVIQTIRLETLIEFSGEDSSDLFDAALGED
ncbi:hypothetical protein GURKE_05010 [Brevundimonas phage vB_BpoS-Gurke]|uniref:Uncharacterized protein n=1 Tax=Brevundimonas phage vB_BpoS-Gurke TaxID=2948599 RepID=A0A9E7SQQ4_9CAUD|nr:hypothetical protein GURKE_05010 [Brevundimonas phage vB_BpoS-Gurke]